MSDGSLITHIVHPDDKPSFEEVRACVVRLLSSTSRQKKHVRSRSSCIKLFLSETPSLSQTVKSSMESMQPWAWKGRVFVDGKYKVIEGFSLPRMDGSKITWRGTVRDYLDEFGHPDPFARPVGTTL